MDSKARSWLTSKEGIGIMIMTILALVAAFYFLKAQLAPKQDAFMAGSSIFDFTVDSSSGQPVSLAEYKGKKAYLLINVASK